ncbi:MAG: YdeI/OmpD-associated family protein [Pseudomonadota bacterium]
MSYFTHAFEATITRHVIGKGQRTVTYTVVRLPEEMTGDLPFADHPRLRVDGEIDDYPFNGAWQPTGDGTHYLMVPKSILREAELSVGSRVEIRFRVADQSAVAVPEALATALDADADLKTKWDALSAGKRRGFAHRVSSAKTEATIAKRVAEVTRMVREGLSYGKGGKVR